jgi:hypothetical protein
LAGTANAGKIARLRKEGKPCTLTSKAKRHSLLTGEWRFRISISWL